MTLEYFYLKFKSKKECIEFIEDLEWSDTPFCPYCNSERFTNLKDEKRYHCNNCNNSYSVTVGTIFHKNKIDLQKWFYVIHLLLNSDEQFSSRSLAKEIKTTKDTAHRIITEIKKALIKNNSLIEKIKKSEQQR